MDKLSKEELVQLTKDIDTMVNNKFIAHMDLIRACLMRDFEDLKVKYNTFEIKKLREGLIR